MIGSMIDRVCFLLCVPLIFSTFSESCLDGTTERLISGSRFSVQDQFFEADSNLGMSNSPQQARLDGNSWCSALRSGCHWLQVTFGMDVNISIIQTNNRYYTYSYLTKFEVHVGDGTEGNIHPLTISADSLKPLVFVRTLYNLENTTLPSPVTTQVLRIVPVEWIPMNNVPCLRLEAFGCPASQVCETEGLLTNDVEILDSIIGSPSILSNSHVNYPINDLVSTSGRGWCAMGDLGSDPYIQLNFTSMVSLTYMKAEGLFRAFVSQFRFEVQDESGNFNIYGITSEPTIFTASGFGPETFSFWRPIQGNTLRLYILNFHRNQYGYVCWNIRLYGCIASTSSAPPTFPMTTTELNTEDPSYTTHEIIHTEGSSYTTPETIYTEGSSYTTQETIHTEGSSYTTQETIHTEGSSYTTQETIHTEEASSNTTQETRTQGQLGAAVVGGAVGGSLGILLALLLLAIVVAAILIFTRRSPQVQLAENDDSAEHTFDNSIYGQGTALPSLYKDTPEHVFDNCIYGEEPDLPNLYDAVPNCASRGEINTENQLARPVIASSITSSMYESIPNTITEFHEPAQDLNGTVGHHNTREAYDNPIYAENIS